MASNAQQRTHQDLKNVGLRAQATAAGLVQLCKELQNAGVLEPAAVARIQDAVANEIALAAPRHLNTAQFRQDLSARLSAIFSGDQPLGNADALAFASEQAN